MRQYEATPRRAGSMGVARSRGAISGVLLVILGLWGALIPFIGPYFNYSYTPNSAWTWTAGRFWLEVLPGLAAILGGLLLASTAHRAVGLLAGLLASASGAWFIVGPVLGRLWNGPEGVPGVPVGSTARQVWEQIGFFSGPGTAILFLGALALGRFSVRSVRDVRAGAGGHDDRTIEKDTSGRGTTFTDNRAVHPEAPAAGQGEGATRSDAFGARGTH
jgi:hypothetical protein